MYHADTLNAALDVRVEGDHPGTVREYLCTVLLMVWDERDEFNGKRPFGSSGWQYDIYIGLIKAGLINGSLDEDGYVELVDDVAAADQLIAAAIKHGFGISQ